MFGIARVAWRALRNEATFMGECREAVSLERDRRELQRIRDGLGGRSNAAIDRDLRRAAVLHRWRR